MMTEALVEQALDEDEDAIEQLVELAKTNPGELELYLPRLLEGGVLWPPTLFRSLDADSKAEIIARLDATEEEEWYSLLLVLAFARGAEVEAAFRRWTTAPPPGVTVPMVYRCMLEAGWLFDDLGRDGAPAEHSAVPGPPRELYGATAYRLVPDGEMETLADVPCPWCRSPMWVALDVDTADPRVAEALAHTGWSGRLRITTCFLCACYTTTYAEVGTDGSARWSDHTVRPEWVKDKEPEQPAGFRLALGERHPNRYAADPWNEGGSALGGDPDWIQDAHVTWCPGCGHAMDYVGMAGSADLYEHGDGAYYLFLHAACGLAGIEYQQT
ncbi:hypothetical protein [Yinghuangia seranimata]|uniref:hypothetical protein n=1 Tax=Yinghuangia seranimata TaxID=408067 RepID=UPI00248AA819|nr:hypothetical protein [Yinghuangia seranimata]MDI2129621.1 hypothetical protein [Yinghuangia seranimata]